MVYTFIDSLIFRASKVDHLSVDELPALPDYEYTENMRERAFRVRLLASISITTSY